MAWKLPGFDASVGTLLQAAPNVWSVMASALGELEPAAVPVLPELSLLHADIVTARAPAAATAESRVHRVVFTGGAPFVRVSAPSLGPFRP
jgi:hypothetical protein